MQRPVIKHFFEAGNSIPVARAQDLAKVGDGKLKLVDNLNVKGINTTFTK